ncbi:MAG: DUF4214 domain-containing protein, partial [Lachnospiraceae bacterium]|nr:DUF4214 domain-containing protein [Lachnospiraceae bacterium]
MKYKKLITALLIGGLVLGQGYWTPVLATMPSEEVQETTEVSTEASTEVVETEEVSTEASTEGLVEYTDFIGSVANSDGTGYTINDFVARLYLIVLGRNYDYDGYSYWVTQIKNGEKDMAEVALGFFYSEEFLKKNLDNEAYVTILYATYLNRKPDTDGYWYWVKQLEDGASRRYVLDGFSNSGEFQRLCAQYATVVEGDGTT